MKCLYLLCFVAIIFSCAEKGSEEIYQGKLEKLVVGDFALKKDASTRYISNIRVVEDGTQE